MGGRERWGGISRGVFVAYFITAAVLAISRAGLFVWVNARYYSHTVTETVVYLQRFLHPETLLAEHTRLGHVHVTLTQLNLIWGSILTLGSFIMATPILVVGPLMPKRGRVHGSSGLTGPSDTVHDDRGVGRATSPRISPRFLVPAFALLYLALCLGILTQAPIIVAVEDVVSSYPWLGFTSLTLTGPGLLLLYGTDEWKLVVGFTVTISLCLALSRWTWKRFSESWEFVVWFLLAAGLWVGSGWMVMGLAI